MKYKITPRSTLWILLIGFIAISSGCMTNDPVKLANLAINDKSWSTRGTAALKLTDQAILAKVAIGDKEYYVYFCAIKKLTDQALLAKVAIEAKGIDAPNLAIKKLTDQALLAKVAIKARDRVVRNLAIKKLTDQALLAQMAIGASKWDIRKSAFGELSKTSLAKLAIEAKDKAVKLAAEVKLGKKTWDDVFLNANLQTSGLGNSLGAIALVEYQKSTSSTVVAACHKFIRYGDTARIPELIELLDIYGDKKLAEDYMNCGQYNLDSAGREWARKRGYNVSTGRGSYRVRWGSDKQ